MRRILYHYNIFPINRGRILHINNILPINNRNIKPPISPPFHFRFALATDISMPNHFGYECRRAMTTCFRTHCGTAATNLCHLL